MEKWTWIIRNAVIVLIVIALSFVLKHQVENEIIVRVDSPNKVVMNTIAKIAAVAVGKQTAKQSIDAGFEKIRKIERLMNRYDPNSQLSKVNMLAAKENVKVDRELFDILQKSVYYYKLTDGAFDITVAPLIDLWKKCAEANSMPIDEQLAEVKKIIGSDKLLLNPNDCSVRFAAEGMKLDLGGIAKGLAVDLAEEEMKKAGTAGGFIAIGGEISCFGKTEKGENWIIGIYNPFVPQGQDENVIAKLALSDRNVSTSGNYRRFYEIGGKRFSHIINPKTGKSADELASVTIITSDGSQADALATAVSVLGAEKGLDLIEKTNDTEAILIKAGSGEIIKSSGVEQYLVK